MRFISFQVGFYANNNHVNNILYRLRLIATIMMKLELRSGLRWTWNVLTCKTQLSFELLLLLLVNFKGRFRSLRLNVLFLLLLLLLRHSQMTSVPRHPPVFIHRSIIEIRVYSHTALGHTFQLIGTLYQISHLFT